MDVKKCKNCAHSSCEEVGGTGTAWRWAPCWSEGGRRLLAQLAGRGETELGGVPAFLGVAVCAAESGGCCRPQDPPRSVFSRRPREICHVCIWYAGSGTTPSPENMTF